ncbi:MAG: hypothetical protein QNJ37_06065 [Crocosphaera sp.]|nr:hypothetical protein [Crocosphaera sp.]
MKSLCLIKQLQEINQVITQDLGLGCDIFPQLQSKSTFVPDFFPILIPYQSEVMLNQTLLKKIIERFVRGSIEMQQKIAQKEPLSRDQLKGLIQLCYWEPELSNIQLSSVMKEIGKIIRDAGGLSQEEYKELSDGNILFDINNYSNFRQKLAVNKVGVTIQEKIETIQTLIENNFQKSYHTSISSYLIK